MLKKPEENTKKPTHGPKSEKGLGALKKPGAVKPGKQNPEADKPTPVITHRYEQKAHVARDCTKCKYSVQVSDTEWECQKEHYFPRTLICFREREEVTATEVAANLSANVPISNEDIIYPWEQSESTSLYKKGDKVTHNDKTWVSTMDGNVWEPGYYGWEEVTE